MKNEIKLVIFDFDGVLADSFNTFYPLIRDAMNYADLSLTPDQYRDLFIGNVHQGFKDFINNKKRYLAFSKFRKTNYDKYYYDGNDKVKLFPGTLEFLRKIGKRYILTVASSSKKDNIKNLLEKNRVEKLFSIILANTATSKENLINEILAKFKLKPEKAVMITDTAGDIKVAKKLGLKTIAVTWGFHSAKTLRSEKPDYLAKSFKILYKNIKAF